jgi:ATP-dependent helicase/nuclease subunit B
MPPDAALRLLEEASGVIAEMGVDEATAALWWPQMERIARWFIECERQWRETARAQHVERDGRIEFPVRGQTFVLTGRADRIDELHDGTLRIMDYKTGALPSFTDTAQGLQPTASDRGPHGGAGRLCPTSPPRPSAISSTSGCRAATRPAR